VFLHLAPVDTIDVTQFGYKKLLLLIDGHSKVAVHVNVLSLNNYIFKQRTVSYIIHYTKLWVIASKRFGTVWFLVVPSATQHCHDVISCDSRVRRHLWHRWLIGSNTFAVPWATMADFINFSAMQILAMQIELFRGSFLGLCSELESKHRSSDAL